MSYPFSVCSNTRTLPLDVKMANVNICVQKDQNSTLFKYELIQRKQNRISSSYIRGKDRYHDGKTFAWFQQSNTLTITLLSAQITFHTHPFRTQLSKREKPHTYTLSLSA